MMWPDCSPPSDSPSASSAASTWRSPTSVSSTAMPRSSMASRNPRFVMTVTTTVFSASSSRAARSNANNANRTSPSTMSPALSTAITRSASPSNASPRSAPDVTTACASSEGSVDPQPSLMFTPSGASCSAVTDAPTSASTRGAIGTRGAVGTVDDHAQPVETPPAERADQMRHIRLRRLGVGRQPPHPQPRRTGRRPLRVCQQLSELALDLVLHLHRQFRPEQRKQLDAVVAVRVVRGRDHCPGHRPRRRHRRHARRRQHTEVDDVGALGGQPR